MGTLSSEALPGTRGGAFRPDQYLSLLRPGLVGSYFRAPHVSSRILDPRTPQTPPTQTLLRNTGRIAQGPPGSAPLTTRDEGQEYETFLFLLRCYSGLIRWISSLEVVLLGPEDLGLEKGCPVILVGKEFPVVRVFVPPAVEGKHVPRSKSLEE